MASFTSPIPSSVRTRLPETIDTILVPTDFSDAAGNAFAYALDLATQLGSHIVLTHIYKPETGFLPETQLEDFVRSFEDYDKTAAFLGGKQKPEIRPILEPGDPGLTLLRLSEELNVDLIIMGTQGAASHDAKPLGSVAAKLIAKAKCPVLAIPEEASYQPITHLVYALPFEPTDNTVVDYLIDFAHDLKAGLTCVHISTEHTDWEEVELENFRETYTRRELAAVRFQMIEDKDLLHGLQKMVSDIRVDVLVMNTRDRNLLERFFDPSLTHAMLMYADMPLLALHV